MGNKIFCIVFFILGIISCNNHKNEKYLGDCNNIIYTKDSIRNINTNIIFGRSDLYVIDSFLVVSERTPSGEKGVHLFNKNNFHYVTSTVILGKGPNEVTEHGTISFNKKDRSLWISDYGKMVMWKFPLDSILNNKNYKPTEKKDLSITFMERYSFFNDSIAIGKAVTLFNNTFEMKMAKLNLFTNEIEGYGYEHPRATDEKSNSEFKLSLKDSIYINCYAFCDLMTICDLDGQLICNVYGHDWGTKREKMKTYYYDVDIINGNIVASYVDGKRIIVDQNQRERGNIPTKFMLFDLKGNYKKTIETGYRFISFCVDEDNNRIIAYYDGRENPLGYFNLN